MAKNDINKEIQARVEAFVEELSGLIREAALESVQSALGSDAAPTARARAGTRSGTRSKAPAKARTTRKKKATTRKKKAGTRKAPARRGKRIRRSEEQLAALGEKVLKHVKANAGDRLEQIGVALKIPTSELKRPIANLLESKALKTTGQRRGTKYFVGRAKAASK